MVTTELQVPSPFKKLVVFPAEEGTNPAAVFEKRGNDTLLPVLDSRVDVLAV